MKVWILLLSGILVLTNCENREKCSVTSPRTDCFNFTSLLFSINGFFPSGTRTCEAFKITLPINERITLLSGESRNTFEIRNLLPTDRIVIAEFTRFLRQDTARVGFDTRECDGFLSRSVNNLVRCHTTRREEENQRILTCQFSREIGILEFSTSSTISFSIEVVR